MTDGPSLEIKLGRFQARAVGWPAIAALTLIAAGRPFSSLVIWAPGFASEAHCAARLGPGGAFLSTMTSAYVVCRRCGVSNRTH